MPWTCKVCLSSDQPDDSQRCSFCSTKRPRLSIIVLDSDYENNETAQPEDIESDSDDCVIISHRTEQEQKICPAETIECHSQRNRGGKEEDVLQLTSSRSLSQQGSSILLDSDQKIHSEAHELRSEESDSIRLNFTQEEYRQMSQDGEMPRSQSRAEREKVREEKRAQKFQEKEEKRLEREWIRVNDQRKRGVFANSEIKVLFDSSFSKTSAGKKMLERLTEEKFDWEVSSSMPIGNINWKRWEIRRDLPVHLFQDNRLLLTEAEPGVELKDCTYCILYLTAKDFLEQVNTGIFEPTISSSLDLCRSSGRSLTVLIDGLYREIRNRGTRALRTPSTSVSMDFFRTYSEAETYLFQLYLKHSNLFRFKLFDHEPESVDYVTRATTALCRSPYQKSLTALRFCRPKRGSEVSGTARLREWFNALLQIPGVSETTAESLLRHYPTPRSLLLAYSRCPSTQHKALLLSDIQLDQRRRIGTRLSAVIYSHLAGQTDFAETR